MSLLQIVAAVILAVSVVYVLRLVVDTFLGMRGSRIVRCPETKEPVAVDLDLRHAVASAALGHPDFRLKDCSRWPEKRHCGQECLRELEAAPSECLVRNVVARWYEGKSCAFCGRAFGALRWHDHRPGLRTPGGVTVQWSEVPPVSLPRLLADAQAVCWDCTVAQTFRHDHPELVIDEPGAIRR